MQKRGRVLFVVVALLTGLLQAVPGQAAGIIFNEPGFASVWNRVDKPVEEIAGLGRGYTWGPLAPGASSTSVEQYNGKPRKVQYFDKARMEINDPGGNPNDLFFVTTGLLVKELVSGQRQDGDQTFVMLQPSTIQVAGDSNEGGGNAVAPTYASFHDLVSPDRGQDAAPGSLIARRIDAAGQLATFGPPEEHTLAAYDSLSRHNVADVFVNFGNARGTVWDGQRFGQASIFYDQPLYILGRPLTEPYWTRAVVGGTERDVMVQLFERRVLTYTPANPDGFKVEMGNVGQHYFRWRYGSVGCDNQPTPPTPLPAPSTTPVQFKGKGTVYDTMFYSPALGRTLQYRVYLPPDYARSTQKYPVLYMLHGFSGTYLEWDWYGVEGWADNMISDGTIRPMIIVLPLGEQAYWLNHANCGPRWADYVALDVVGQIDATYRTLADAPHRAIGGLSMGAHGALQIGFNFPQVFSILGAHSPTLRTKEQAPDYWGDAAYYATIDPVSLARVKKLDGYKIALDLGQSDTEWQPRLNELRQVLQQRGLTPVWNSWPGGHEGEYWAAHVPDYLKFYSASFPPA